MNLRSATAAGRYLASMVAVRLGMPALWGATNSGSEDELLELMPPYQEMLPTWWELHGTWVVLGVAVMLAVVALLVWLWHRPKPVPPVPPEVLAREELEQLRQQPETGDVLSQVSRCVRRYVTEIGRASCRERV